MRKLSHLSTLQKKHCYNGADVEPQLSPPSESGTITCTTLGAASGSLLPPIHAQI